MPTALFAVALTLGAGLLLARRPPQVEVRVRAGRLVVELGPLDALWALRRSLSVPATAVTDVAVLPRPAVGPPGLRLPGTHLPGLLTAGVYGVGGRRSFWDVRRGPEVLLVTCATEDDPGPAGPRATFARLVLEVDRPHEVADRLRGELGLR